MISLLAGFILGFVVLSFFLTVFALRRERKMGRVITVFRLVTTLAPFLGALFGPVLWIVVMKHGFDFCTGIGLLLGMMLVGAISHFQSHVQRKKE
jgi:hypothetical protein